MENILVELIKTFIALLAIKTGYLNAEKESNHLIWFLWCSLIASGVVLLKKT